jgi:hypothetical protein
MTRMEGPIPMRTPLIYNGGANRSISVIVAGLCPAVVQYVMYTLGRGCCIGLEDLDLKICSIRNTVHMYHYGTICSTVQRTNCLLTQGATGGFLLTE